MFGIRRRQKPLFRVIGITKDRRHIEARAQDLAREIALYEAPVIALFDARVKANELRRANWKKLLAGQRFLKQAL